MTLKTKLISLVAMLCLMIGVLLVGIYAAQTQTITMQGSVNFEIADKSLYMKDVRIQMDNNSEPTSIDGFLPGYINGNFDLNLGTSYTNTYGSFALYFDIVNTVDETGQSYYYSPLVAYEQTGIDVSVSGAIDKGTVLPENVATADINGTIKLTIINPTETSVDLSKITITIYQAEVYTDFVFDDHGTLLSYTGTSTNVTIPSSYAMIGEPTEMTLDYQTEEDAGNNALILVKMTNFIYIYNGQEMFFEDVNDLFEFTNGGNLQLPCQFIYNDYSNVVFIENNDIQVTAIQGAFAMNTTIQEVEIPNTVTNIGVFTFAMNELSNVNIPGSVKKICANAFAGCANLISVVFAKNSQLEYVGYSAFSACSNLTSITLPSSLKCIMNWAFSDTSLTSITIPSGVLYIQRDAFIHCMNLESVVFENTEGWYQTDNDGNYIMDMDFTNPNAIAGTFKSGGGSTSEDGFFIRK